MSSKKDNYWVPLADLMTVLMVFFLFMAISYMVIIKKKQAEKDKIIQDFQDSRVELLDELRKEFQEDFKKSKWNAVLDTTDLSIKFVDERILFDYDKSDLKEEFRNILSDFFPRYLRIILQKKYLNKISEVRVEGHTSSEGDYIYNLQLSQDRTRKVVEFLRYLPSYQSLAAVEKSRLQHWLTANGLSYGRTLDKNGTLTSISMLAPDETKCRRVEFRIVTTSDELIKTAIQKMKE
jgi:outer membrane protein OmpA-like peptidoglycan-associated protein